MKLKMPSKSAKSGLPKAPGKIPMNTKKSPVIKQSAVGRKAMKGK